MEIKVSVIMPVYNGEKYLREALNSIKNQTLKEYELICVNDGSTDSTQEILEEYETQDAKIKIIQNHERVGAALSRNKALNVAEGEYLCFADADDLRSREMLEYAYNSAQKSGADVIIHGITRFKDEPFGKGIRENYLETFKEKYCRSTFNLSESAPLDDIQWPDNLGSKIFRKAFILQNKLQFQNLPCSNDVYFVMMSLYLAKKILCVNKILTFQRDHQTPTRISYYRDPMCAVKAWEAIAKKLKQSGLWEQLTPHFVMRFLYSMDVALRRCDNKQHCQEVYAYIRGETLDRLAVKESGTYSQVNEYIKKWLRLMEREEKIQVWQASWNYMEMCMEESPEVVNSLFTERKKTYIWGGGKYGRTIARYCRDHSLNILGIIDNNPILLGDKIEGIPVVWFDDIADNVDRIVVSSSWIYEQVYQQIRKRNSMVEIVDVIKFINK